MNKHKLNCILISRYFGLILEYWQGERGHNPSHMSADLLFILYNWYWTPSPSINHVLMMHSASSIFFHCHLLISVIKYSNKTNLAEQGVHCGSQSSVAWKLQQIGGPLYKESKVKKQSDEHMLQYSSLFHLIQSKISGREWNLLQWVSQLNATMTISHRHSQRLSLTCF